MNEEYQKEYEEHFSPDGERIQYLMEHPEEFDKEGAHIKEEEKFSTLEDKNLERLERDFGGTPH